MDAELLSSAIARLQEGFPLLNWSYHDLPAGGRVGKMYRWPGPENENILVCVHKSEGVQELFHRHDFFYFNYTYKGRYDSLSHKYDNRITITEKELYAGQPFAGHALCVHDDEETTIIGLLIRRETFCRIFLPMLSASSRLFHFFLDPATNSFSEEFIHFRVEDDGNIRALLEMMAVEYAYKRSDTQEMLKPLALSFLMQLSRQYALINEARRPERLSERIVEYMREHFDSATLRDIAAGFSYHPNYISSLLTRELGKSFSQILLELRMERAVILLRETELSVQEVALLLGYSNSSNFYKAFRQFYQMSPREYIGRE